MMLWWMQPLPADLDDKAFYMANAIKERVGGGPFLMLGEIRSLLLSIHKDSCFKKNDNTNFIHNIWKE